MWDDIARQYWLWCINNRWYYHRLGMEIWKVVGEPKCILDVGSGPGVFAEELKKLFPTSNIVCLDASMEMCRL
ncbi:MAG: class I SAM-dependent methyltransferase, partial [Archaeoglobaceae archaeon]|nr:class I SAM-dependent methyltransferase [Archaeoglobaceae archaeon]